MSKGKKVWQIQRKVGVSDTGKPEWRDICSKLGQHGPARKAAATAFLHQLRADMSGTPGGVYRLVKVSPL